MAYKPEEERDGMGQLNVVSSTNSKIVYEGDWSSGTSERQASELGYVLDEIHAKMRAGAMLGYVNFILNTIVGPSAHGYRYVLTLSRPETAE